MTEETRTAIVTGASSGIGAATARRLAQAGVRCVVNYSGNAAGAEAVVADSATAGVDALAVQADVSSDADCQRLAATAMDRWGRIDILVNNAGFTVNADHADMDALSAPDFQRIYDVNVIGSYQMTRAARDALAKSGVGSVVNTSSIAGVVGIGSSVAYAASKGALNTMTLSLARALAPEIRVNAVCPGFVESAWWQRRHDDATIAALTERAASTALLRRTSSSDDIAEAVVFFALGGASITGQLLVVDNGVTLNVGQPLADAHR